MTGLGYIGAGTFEAPYKTMGQFDTNMDTAIALNSHGAFSQGQGGIAGNFESAIAYHAMMGPVELGFMYAASDNTATDHANTDRGDYSLGLTFKDMIMGGLTFGYATYNTRSISAKINLSKHSDITIGHTKQDFDQDGTDRSTTGLGLTHKF